MIKAGVVLRTTCVIALMASCALPGRGAPHSPLRQQTTTGADEQVPLRVAGASARSAEPLPTTDTRETAAGAEVVTFTADGEKRTHNRPDAGGAITLNFNDQPVRAAVHAVLGDVLHVPYVIAPDVKGTVTFSTSHPVASEALLPILEMLLAWTGNALVRQDAQYLVVPFDRAVRGTRAPALGAAAPAPGYAARLFPLHYIAADAMQSLLQPFAKVTAFLLVDPARNLLILAGTPDELTNYQRIVKTFDVNWLRGMSVAVISVQHVAASTLLSQLQRLLESSGENVSGMVRLMALRSGNRLVVIAAQPSYIADLRRWAAILDNGAGSAAGVYVHDVVNVRASDLAKQLNEVFGRGQRGIEVAGESSHDVQQGFGGFAATSGAREQGGQAVSGRNVRGAIQSSASQGTFAFTTDAGVRVAATDWNNQLLVHATPDEWHKLLPVIERLDDRPLQVQVETRVLEVTLTGQFQFGVQYYLTGLIGTQPGSPPNTNEAYHRHQGAVGLAGVTYSPADALFYSFAGDKLQFALRALESSGVARVLSTPSAIVLNNRRATFKVGQQIPVVRTAIVPGITSAGSGSSAAAVNAASVAYINTGVLLDVIPRANPGGLVYLDVQQVVSSPTTRDRYGNYILANRSLSTEVAVRSGQTVLLGGLVEQARTKQDGGVPWLNRIPAVGRLFGSTTRTQSRTELIVLITPRVIRNADDAQSTAMKYTANFEMLKPIVPSAGSTAGVGNDAPNGQN